MEPPPTVAMYTPFLLSIESLPHAITHRPSKRKASPGSEQPLSEKRGKHLQSPTPVAGEGHKDKTANTSTVASTPASIQDVTSIIEEFTDVIAESPVAKRVSEAKTRTLLDETSIVTTPGRRTDDRSRSKASVVRPKTSTTATAKQSATRKKTGKAKPELVTPAEFARRLQEQAVTVDSLPPPPPHIDGRKARQSSAKLPITKAVQLPQHLKGYVIFYTGGDLTYASARTRGCMNYVRVLRVTFLSHVSAYKQCAHRFINTVGPYSQSLTPQRPRTSSRKPTRKIPFARLVSSPCRKSRWRYRQYIGAG